MDISNILRLQAQVAHAGGRRPQAKPVQGAEQSIKKEVSNSSMGSSSTDSSSTSSSISSKSNSVDLARCTRCQRSISVDSSKDNAVSYGAILHYCSTCTAILERKLR